MKLKKSKIFKIFAITLAIPAVIVPSVFMLSSCSSSDTSSGSQTTTYTYDITSNDVIQTSSQIIIKDSVNDKINKKISYNHGDKGVCTGINIDLHNILQSSRSSNGSSDIPIELVVPNNFSFDSITSINIFNSYTYNNNYFWINNKSWMNLIKSSNLLKLEVSDVNFASTASTQSLTNAQKAMIKKDFVDLAKKDKLTSLSMKSMDNITDYVNPIGNLSDLVFLSLENDGLQSFPNQFGNLTNLTQLYMGGGSNDTDLGSIPSAIGYLTNLKSLSFNGSGITSLPTEIGNLSNLTWLDIHGNNSYQEISYVPTELIDLNQLQYFSYDKGLKIGNSSVTTTMPKTITDARRSWPKLEVYNDNSSY